MNCADFEILLQLAADGEVTDGEQAALESHLDGCLACRRKEAWLELLDEQYAVAMRPSIEPGGSLADAVVDALKEPQSAQASVAGQTAVPKSRASKPRSRKTNLFTKVVSSIWSRRKRKLAKDKARLAKEDKGSSWLDASVSAIQPAPTSLDGFRAAKQGVSSAISGPMQAIKLVASAVPRKDRS